MAQQEAERIQNMDKKLSSLHLDGLVDFSKEAARFVVLGSTNKHYTITLSDARHTCQCVDFRYVFAEVFGMVLRVYPQRLAAVALKSLGHCKLISQVLSQQAAAVRTSIWRRIRKHHCKHIRLVLTQLDIGDHPGDWWQVMDHFAVCSFGGEKQYRTFL